MDHPGAGLAGSKALARRADRQISGTVTVEVPSHRKVASPRRLPEHADWPAHDAALAVAAQQPINYCGGKKYEPVEVIGC
jgi:hypothetical protein